MLGDSNNIFSSAQAVTATGPTFGTDCIPLSTIQRIDRGMGFAPVIMFSTAGLATPAHVGASVTLVNATDLFTLNGHGMPVGTKIVLGGTTAPGNASFGTVYFVTNPTTNTFQIATTLANALAGVPLDLSSDGTALALWSIPQIEFQAVAVDRADYSQTATPFTENVVVGSSGPLSLNVPRRVTFNVNGQVTLNGHLFAPGTPVVFSGGGTLPASIVSGTTYYVVTDAANTFRLATTYQNAMAGTADRSISDSGSGVMNVTVADGLFTVGGPSIYVDVNPTLAQGRSFLAVRYVLTGACAAPTAFNARYVLAEEGTKNYKLGWRI